MADAPQTQDQADPKQRILDAAVELFSKKGYAATGVRELARRAGVNQAMVNYYFGAKINVLKAIFELALRSYAQVIVRTLAAEEDRDLESTVRAFFREAIEMMRRHQAVFRITWSELHHEESDIAAFKAQLVRETLLPSLLAFVERHRDEIAPELQAEIVGPTLPGLVAWHFMVAPVFMRVIGVTLDDAFYEKYADQLARLALHGLLGSGEK